MRRGLKLAQFLYGEDTWRQVFEPLAADAEKEIRQSRRLVGTAISASIVRRWHVETH